MADPTGEADRSALRLDFDRRLMLQFRGSTITSDAGLLAYRELDDALHLTDTAADKLADARTGKNGRHRLAGLLRQSVFGRLAGYEDVNDAERLCRDPAMRWGSYCSILVPIWNSRRRTRARAARKTWSTKPVSNHQNGTVVALRPQQQAKITAGALLEGTPGVLSLINLYKAIRLCSAPSIQCAAWHAIQHFGLPPDLGARIDAPLHH